MSGRSGPAEYLFVVLSYNHEAYILEHLESIRYQIERWGCGRSCSILVADDSSRDKTVCIARRWLEANKNSLASYTILESHTNLGTCRNFIRVFPFVKGMRLKVLAGDDLYSAENIFELVDAASDGRLMSGLPLMLFPEGLVYSRSQTFNMLASEAIYKRDFLKAMKEFSAIHTPSIAYDDGALALPGMADFIGDYAVVEDFAMQICLAESRPGLRYKIDSKFYVYYRRTHQSTYIIKNSAFTRDKTRMYRYLAKKEKNPIKRALIRNRILCLHMKGIYKYVFNANSYIYGAKVLMRLPGILKKISSLDCPMQKYENHLKDIQVRAEASAAILNDINGTNCIGNS